MQLQRRKKGKKTAKKENCRVCRVWSSTACHKVSELGRMKTETPEQETGHHSVFRKQSKLRAPPGSARGALMPAERR